jgi:predicted negative regulator of RcsB-dependent stress response
MFLFKNIVMIVRKELIMETVFEIIKHLLSMRTSWVVIGIILLAFMIFIWSIFKSSAMADQIATELYKNNLKITKHSKSDEDYRAKELIKWKKHRCLRKLKLPKRRGI